MSRVSALHCAIKRLWRQTAREATCDQQTCHKTRITCDRKLWRPAMRSCTTCPILTQSTSPPRVLISTNSLRSTQQDGSARPRPCFTYTRMRRLIHASVSDTRLFECAGPKLRGRMLCCMHARYAARTQPSPYSAFHAASRSPKLGSNRCTQRYTETHRRGNGDLWRAVAPALGRNVWDAECCPCWNGPRCLAVGQQELPQPIKL